MDCVDKNHTSYDRLRQIGNLRFDLKPTWMCYCYSEADVLLALKFAKDKNLPVRIRAGGHQHEGMCSGNNVCVIDVSNMDRVEIDNLSGRRIARVGAGAKNSKVYDTLWDATPRQLFGGGGCGDVRVGGLVQGGGWGPYSRSLGMTCDKLFGFRIVRADSNEPLLVRRTDAQYADLFKAVCGGGGGNWGVVTEYEIETEETGDLTQFTATWIDTVRRPEVLKRWIEFFPKDDDKKHSSFCRITVKDTPKQAPIVVAGNYRGNIDETYAFLYRLLGSWLYTKAELKLQPVHKAQQVYSHPEAQPIAPPPDVDVLLLPDLTNTCLGRPYPHRVSSCFPSPTFGPDAVKTILEHFQKLEAEDPVPDSRRYLSLHCMGGQIKANNAASCFAWRDKPFMLQYQAWWIRRDDEKVSEACMRFVSTFRDKMRAANYTEGSFINFPDREIPLPEYYRDRYGELVGIKAKYDRNNFFKFEMSIPTS